jgi:hypothetical protein
VRWPLSGDKARGRAWTLLLVLGLSLASESDRGAPPLTLMGHARALWAEEIEGDVEVLVEDGLGWARERGVVRRGQHRLWIRWIRSAPISLQTGMHIRARGMRMGAEFLITEADLAEPLIVTEVAIEHRVALLLVNFSDRPIPPYSTETARQVLATTAEFFRENAYGRVSLHGDVFGWFTLPMSSSICDPFRLAEEAHASAIASGIDLAAYDHLVYAFPKSACSWWGMGTIGGAPSSAWINGPLAFEVLTHELGHGLGLSHAHALECGWVALGSECQVLEYGDTVDVMGMGAGHLGAFQKERLGWLREERGELLRATADGLFVLMPYQSGGDGPKALKILRSEEAGHATWYYIEYRPPLGFDRFLQKNSNVSRGVIVRLGIMGGRGGSFLLDMTPETTSWFDPALTIGRSFTDPWTGVTISVREIEGDKVFLAIVGVARGR